MEEMTPVGVHAGYTKLEIAGIRFSIKSSFIPQIINYLANTDHESMTPITLYTDLSSSPQTIIPTYGYMVLTRDGDHIRIKIIARFRTVTFTVDFNTLINIIKK